MNVWVVYRERNRDYCKLSITKAKSQDLELESWGTDGMFHSKAAGRAPGTVNVFVQSSSGRRHSFYLSQGGGVRLFVLFRPSTNSMGLTHIEKDNILCSVYL